jgi:hypothetical protein
MGTELFIQNGSLVHSPVTAGRIKLSLSRRGSPGRLEFAVIKEGALDFTEGNAVRLSHDGTPMFFGYVFSKRRARDGIIHVTAYDQLRYLKNRDTFVSQGLTASGLVRRLSSDFGLRTGEIEETAYVIDVIDEVDRTLFDMIESALSETFKNTGRRYVLYDDMGRLTLKNIKSLVTDFVIDKESARDFIYESGIDDETYDRVSLVCIDRRSGINLRFTAKNDERAKEWGVLSYHERISEPEGAAARAESLLKYFQTKKRRLFVRGAFGDVSVRGGSIVRAALELGDIVVNSPMTAEQVTHTFENGEHFMDIRLTGGDFIV